VLNLHKCFQIKTVKVLLYFPGSLMFRNKHWQCLFRAFWSISERVSSMLSPRLTELAILFYDWKAQAWKHYFKKRKKEETEVLRETPAAARYLSHGTPTIPGDSCELGPVTACSGAGCGTASPGPRPAHERSFTCACSSLPVYFPSFPKSPALPSRIFLPPASITGRYFFHTPPNPV